MTRYTGIITVHVKQKPMFGWCFIAKDVSKLSTQDASPNANQQMEIRDSKASYVQNASRYAIYYLHSLISKHMYPKLDPSAKRAVFCIMY